MLTCSCPSGGGGRGRGDSVLESQACPSPSSKPRRCSGSLESEGLFPDWCSRAPFQPRAWRSHRPLERLTAEADLAFLAREAQDESKAPDGFAISCHPRSPRQQGSSQPVRSPAAGSGWHKGRLSTQCDLPEAWGSVTHLPPRPAPLRQEGGTHVSRSWAVHPPHRRESWVLKPPPGWPLTPRVWGRNPETILNHQESSTLVKR